MRKPETCAECGGGDLHHSDIDGLGLIGKCGECEASYYFSAGEIVWVPGSAHRAYRAAMDDVRTVWDDSCSA